MKDLFKTCISNAEEIVKTFCLHAAVSKYGKPLPVIISDRLNQEFKAIEENSSFEPYLVAMMIAQDSHSDGYITRDNRIRPARSALPSLRDTYDIRRRKHSCNSCKGIRQ